MDLKNQCNPYANLPFVAYRLLLAAYFTVFLVVHLSLSIEGVGGLKILIYLSDWTLILTTIYLIVAFLNAATDLAFYRWYGTYLHYFDDEPPFLYRLQWFLFNTCLITSLLIVVSFWPTVGLHLPAYTLAENINIHALPALVLVIDLLVTAIPICFLHVIFPIAYGGIYMAFAAIYWAAGGKDPYGLPYIYPILNFNHPRAIGLVIVGETVGAVVFQWLICGIKLARDKIARDCNCPGSRQSPERRPLTELATVTSYQ